MAEPDAALQERITAGLVAGVIGNTHKKTKKILRELESQLGLAPNALDAFKSWVFKNRVEPIYKDLNIALPSSKGKKSSAGSGKKKRSKKPKEPKKKKLKSLIEGQAEEEEGEEEESSESESEENNDYDYNDGFLNDDVDEELSSSSSDDSAAPVRRSGASSNRKRLVMDDDDEDGIELDEDDKLLLQDASGTGPAFSSSTTQNKSNEEELFGRRKRNLDDDSAGSEDEGEDGEDEDDNRALADGEELDSGVSSNVYDSDENMDGFIEEDDLPEGEEGERERRRRRRAARKERRERRAAAGRGLLNQEISPENRAIYLECFSIENFEQEDLYLSDTDEDTDENENATSSLIRAPLDERKLYMTRDDAEIRDMDVCERIQLAERECSISVDFDQHEQLAMLVCFVINQGVLESEQSVEECLKLFFQEKREVTYVHVYCTDRTMVTNLDSLWRIYDLGWEFQLIFRKFTECIRLVKERLSSKDAAGAQEGAAQLDDHFWDQTLDSSLFHSEAEEEEEEERVQRSKQEYWLRRLHEVRFELNESVVQDFYGFLVCLTTGGTADSSSLRTGASRTNPQFDSNLASITSCLKYLGSIPLLGLQVKNREHTFSGEPTLETRAEIEAESLTDDIAQLAANFAKHLLFRDPHVRARVREMFKDMCTLSTRRTRKGETEISDIGNRFYSCANLKHKPVTEFLNPNEHVENLEQALLVDIAQRQHLIDVTLHCDEIAIELKTVLRALFLRGDDWDTLREEIITSAVNKHFIPWGKRETFKLMVTRARENATKRVAEKFTQRVCMAPFSFASLPQDASFVEERVLDPESPTGNFAAVFLSDDPRQNPSFFVCLNGDGMVKFHSVIDVQGGGKLETSLEQCMLKSEPVVVLVNAGQKTKLVLRVLEDLANKLFEDMKKKRNEKIAERWKGWFASFVSPNDDVASAFAMSESGEREFPKEHINMRRCVAMVRSTLCFPLATWTGLMHDLSVSAHRDRTRVPLLSLNLHELQDYLQSDDVLRAYERALLNTVMLTGVDLNKCILFDFYSSVLRFAPGLGFRKAQHVLKRLKAKARLVRSRGDVRNVMGANVFDSCAGFLKVAKIHDRQALDDDDYMEDEDEDDEDMAEAGEDEEEEEEEDDVALDSDEEQTPRRRKTSASVAAVPKIRKTCLDRTRIHPNDAPIAVAVCERFCALLQRGETGERALHYAMKKLDIFHDASFLLERQQEVFQVFQQQRTVHLLPDVANRGLQDQLPMVEQELCDGRDGKYFSNLFTVRFIIEELRFPFKDKRQPFHPPSEAELFFLCSGEDASKLQVGSAISFLVEQVPNEMAFRRVAGKIPSSGFRVDLNLLDGDVADRDNDADRFNQLQQLTRAVQNNGAAELARLNEYLRSEFGLKPDVFVDAVIKEIDFKTLKIKAKLKSKHHAGADSILNDLYGGGAQQQSQHWDPYFVPFQPEQRELLPHTAAAAAAPAPTAEFRPRNIAHHMFQNVSRQQAEDLLLASTAKVGDAVLRPSARGFTHICLSWRWSRDPARVEHLEIEERSANGGPKDGNDPNLAPKLLLKEREYDDVDEILATYVEPIAMQIRELQQFKYYRAFSVEATEGLVRDTREQNPQGSFPYFICPHANTPRLFYLVYQCGSRPRRVRIIARPHGLEMANKTYKDLKALINYFKTHTKELEQAVAALSQQQQQPMGGAPSRASRWGDAAPSAAALPSMFMPQQDYGRRPLGGGVAAAPSSVRYE